MHAYAHARGGRTTRGERRMIKNSRGCEDVHTRCIAMKHRSVKTTYASLGKKEGKWFPAIARFFLRTIRSPRPFPVRASFSISGLLQPLLPVATFGRRKNGRRDGISEYFFSLSNFISRLHEFLNRVTRLILVVQETSFFLFS